MRWTPTIFSNIEELKGELEARHTLWHSLSEWKDLKDGYEKMIIFVFINYLGRHQGEPGVWRM